MATILIVDDDPVMQAFVEELLLQEGYDVVLAGNGREALNFLEYGHCDLILMDITMPELDGYQTTRRIKFEMQKDQFVPVVFLTAVDSDLELAHCLECGGDDFVTKPPSPVILKARIAAWLQRSEMANRLARDREDVERVILGMRQDKQFDSRGLRVLMTAVEKANGDIVLSARRLDGVQYLLVGDFTGHGLAAAICGPLVADLFYRLTRRNLPLWRIIQKMNVTIIQRLPVNMFLACAFVELDWQGGVVTIWNAGFPPVVQMRSGVVVRIFSSMLPPMGISERLGDGNPGERYPLLAGDRLYLFSDGCVETRSEGGEEFGERRLIRYLEEHSASGLVISTFDAALEAFRGGADAHDDVTMVEIVYAESPTEETGEVCPSRLLHPTRF
ncbi:MAG: fused response regulator/phosphatase [Magnetococcales bacterium]|nr:fused response regulator/phosphatase [Magnetococcales bacterium]